MFDYTFICPNCGQEARIVERASVIRDTNMIGFNLYEHQPGGRYWEPEFSVWDEDGDPDSIDYVCSECEWMLDVTYEQLYAFVKEHGSIENAESEV